MRVAIVIPIAWDAAAFSTDPRILAGGFDAIGHSAKIVCATGSTLPPGEAVPALAVDRKRMESVQWWREQRFDLAIVYTWLHGHHGVVGALVESGTFTISKGDTAGLHGARAHPWATLNAAIQSSDGLTSTLKGVWLWAKRLAVPHEHANHARPFVTNLRRAHVTVVETDAAHANLRRFLRSASAPELVEKIHVVPNPVALPFITVPIPNPKERLIYAVGRWGSAEKNPELLVRVLERHLSCDRKARAVIAGSGSLHVSSAVAGQVECVGVVERSVLAHIAAMARICLVTSRHESFHLGAHEALTVGATIVGTPIPVVREMSADGSCGRFANSHRARAVNSALAAEMRAWDEGLREPCVIASSWRQKLAPDAVAKALVQLAVEHTDTTGIE